MKLAKKREFPYIFFQKEANESKAYKGKGKKGRGIFENLD